MQKRSIPFMALPLMIVALLLSACGNANGGSGSSNNSASQNTPSPQTVLQNTQAAMKKVTSAHYDLKESFQNQAQGTTTTGGNASSNINLTGTGDEKVPDQSQLDSTVTAGSSSAQPIKVGEVMTADKLYIKSTKGQWYVIDKSKLNSGNGSAIASAASVSQTDRLVELASKGKVTDQGYATVNGIKLRHLTIAFDKNNFADLINSNTQASSSAQTQQVVNSLKNFKGVLDLWIDETTNYTHRTELQMSYTLDMSKLQAPGTSTGSAPSSLSSSIDMQIDLSKFNQPVTINVPTNAQPASSLLQALQ